MLKRVIPDQPYPLGAVWLYEQDLHFYIPSFHLSGEHYIHRRNCQMILVKDLDI